MEEITFRILFLLILLILSFIFSGTESALFSLTPSQIWKLKSKGKSGRMVANFVEDPLSTMLASFTGNEIANVFITSVLTYIFSEIFGRERSFLAFFMAFPVILLFAEVVPKTLGVRYPEEFSRRGIFLVRLTSLLVSPLKKMLLPLFEFLFGKVDIQPTEEEVREEVLDILERMYETGELSEIEFSFAKEIVEFRDLKVFSVMTPRTKLFQIPIEMDFQSLKEYIKDVPFSRIPIYRHKRDDVVGILYVKDLLPYIDADKDFAWQALLRKPYYVPENKPLLSLFREFRANNINFSLVVDEYGNIVGAVTARDLLRGFLVKAKIHEPPIQKIDEKKYTVDAMMPFDEFIEELGITLDEEGFYTTVGSYFIEKLGRLPLKGDIVETDKMRMKALEAEERSVRKLEVEIIGE